VERLLYGGGNVGGLNGQRPKYVGRVGAEVTVEQAYEMARYCALNHLAAMKSALGDLERIERVVKVTGYVNAAPGFVDMARVVNGESDLLAELRRTGGDRGDRAASRLELASGLYCELMSPAAPLAPETLARLARVSTATLCTRLFKAGFRSVFLSGLKPVGTATKMVGPAVTVRYVPAREDLSTFESLGDPAHPQRKTIEEIPAGAVLVLDCRGIESAAGLGDILVARLKARGAAGAVLDGGVRDFAGIASLGLPVYAKGPAAPANVHRHLAVEANVPIGCADVLVMPGDIMVGDGDGVVCIPRAQADKIAGSGLEQEELEAFVLGKIQAGAPLRGTYPPSPATVAEFEAWRRGRG